MATHRRSRIIPSRRRVEDDGEEDGSVCADMDDDSLSEDTASSHPDDDREGEGSDGSEHEVPHQQETNGHGKGKPVHDVPASAQGTKSTSPANNIFESRVSETEAMLNGMKLTEEGEGLEELNFDDMKHDLDAVAASARQDNDKSQKRETLFERKKREHEEYIKEKDANPAFVPTRGGFFLHDKRSTNSITNGQRPSNNKPKGKPHGLIVDSSAPRRPPQKPDVMDGPWRHDLHETVIQDPPPVPSHPAPRSYHQNAPSMPATRPVPTARRSSPPNRSFSTTVLVGNVSVIVYMPGMKNPVPFSAVPKKQHTRLPQHRPPLRRDKPVRISLPGQSPRYIFPAMERSFIFIPRALRPNQQAYRGRGRGGFYGGRGPSVYGGSTYTASLPMSRRSSLGRAASRNGIGSPAGSMISRPAMVAGEGGKPVVRLPPNAQPPPVGPSQPTNFPPPGPAIPQPQPQPAYGPPQHAPFRENRPHPTIPMHQPRPQKTVSIADIESPMAFPPHQQEQSFHQHMQPGAGHGFATDTAGYPPHTRNISHPPQASATPLSQIPERAIHAPPFQPVPYQPQQAAPYYPASSYPPGPSMYPVPHAEYPPYHAPGPAPNFIPSGQQVPYGMPPPPPPEQTSSDQQSQPGTVAHEANGTVYYYDASQVPDTQYSNPPYNALTSQGGVVGMGGMMTPPGPAYYYPPPQNGTVYYS